MLCLICKKQYKRVCRHAQQTHGVTAREYKEMFNLDVKRGILSQDDRAIMRAHNLKNKAYKNLTEVSKQFRFKPGHQIRYVRSHQTVKRLQKNIKKAHESLIKKYGRNNNDSDNIHDV